MKKIVLLLLCLALTAASFGCGASERTEPTAQTPEPTEATVPSTTEDAAEEPVKEIAWQEPASRQELRLLFDETIVTEDGQRQFYQIPLLNCVGGDSNAVNQEITRKFAPLMPRIRSGKAQELAGIGYELHRFRIYTLSLVLWLEFADGSRSYAVYTLSLADGRRMDNAEILEELNISQENFLLEAKARAAEFFEECHEGAAKTAAYRKALEATCGEENVRLEMQMYVDHDGHLMLIAPIASPYGGPDRDMIFSLQKEFTSIFE